MTNDVARELLGRPVRADGVCLGTVGAVWVDVRDDVLGMARRVAAAEAVGLVTAGTG